MAEAGFLSRYLSGPLPYNRKQNVLSASLNKYFLPSVPRFSMTHEKDQTRAARVNLCASSH